MARFLYLTSAVALALAAPYAPCRAPYATPAARAFETPCFDSLAALGAVEVRRYPARTPAHARTARAVHANLTGAIINFSEAVTNGAGFLFCYFEGACSTAHTNLLESRTVPLLVRPPQRGAGDANWAIDMALSPSLWPGAAPAGEDGIDIIALDALVAARHCVASGPPVEADFTACLAALEADAPELKKAGFAIDAVGAWSPTYAFFEYQNQTAGPFDIEVWVSVLAAAATDATGSAPAFAHPGVLVGAADIVALRSRLAARAEPTYSFYMTASASAQGSASYAPYGPPANGTISCGYYDQPNIGCSEEDSDVDAAYTQALLFAIGGEPAHAAKARAIVNLYSAGLREYNNNTDGTCCGNEALQAAWVSAKITRAAELLRHTPGSGWTADDSAAFNALMYDVHLPHLINGTSANGNWMASFLEGMLGIAVFSENATLFDHAVKAWRDRAPSYFYVTADGAAPPLDPQPNCEPQPLCEWYNQTLFDSRVTGVCQETCRDMGHMQMGMAAFINGAATATLNGVDLLAQNAQRLFAASEFAATLLLNATPAVIDPALLCDNNPVHLALMPTLEIAHALFVRLGLDDVQTRAQLAQNVRPHANPYVIAPTHTTCAIPGVKSL
jgi:hypothetical protein